MGRAGHGRQGHQLATDESCQWTLSGDIVQPNDSYGIRLLKIIKQISFSVDNRSNIIRLKDRKDC